MPSDSQAELAALRRAHHDARLPRADSSGTSATAQALAPEPAPGPNPQDLLQRIDEAEAAMKAAMPRVRQRAQEIPFPEAEVNAHSEPKPCPAAGASHEPSDTLMMDGP